MTTLYTYPALRLPVEVTTSTEAARRTVDLSTIIIDSITKVLNDHGLYRFFIYHNMDRRGYYPEFTDSKEAFLFKLKGDDYFRPMIQKEINRLLVEKNYGLTFAVTYE